MSTRHVASSFTSDERRAEGRKRARQTKHGGCSLPSGTISAWAQVIVEMY